MVEKQIAPNLLKAGRAILAVYDLEGLTVTSQFPLSDQTRRLRAAMDDMRKAVVRATQEALDADTT